MTAIMWTCDLLRNTSMLIILIEGINIATGAKPVLKAPGPPLTLVNIDHCSRSCSMQCRESCLVIIVCLVPKRWEVVIVAV